MTEAAAVLRSATAQDRPVLERLWQLYSHDMSELRGSMPNAQGEYRAGRFPGYFDSPDHAGYLIVHDGSPAGFAFVTGVSGGHRSMGDFFVVRALRRQHVGYDVARQLLAAYPGPWEIGFQAENGGAPHFWRRVATDTVGTQWREELRPVPDKPHIPPDHFLLFSV